MKDCDLNIKILQFLGINTEDNLIKRAEILLEPTEAPVVILECYCKGEGGKAFLDENKFVMYGKQYRIEAKEIVDGN